MNRSAQLGYPIDSPDSGATSISTSDGGVGSGGGGRELHSEHPSREIMGSLKRSWLALRGVKRRRHVGRRGSCLCGDLTEDN